MNPIQTITQDCFGAIRQLRHMDPGAASPERLQRRLRGFIDKLQQDLKDADFSQQDVQDVTYAIVALADEVALNAGEPLSGFWMGSPLQFRYFRENTAGTGFFDRLEEVRGDPSRSDVLQVYVLCLQFGFQGKYRIRGGEVELMELFEDLDRDLRRGLPSTEVLSPHGERPIERMKLGKRSLPLVLVSAGVLVVAVLVYGVLRWSLSSNLQELRSVIVGAQQQ